MERNRWRETETHRDRERDRDRDRQRETETQRQTGKIGRISLKGTYISNFNKIVTKNMAKLVN